MDKIELHNILDTNDVNLVSKLINKDELDIEISYLSNFGNTKKIRDIIKNICIRLKITNKDIYKIILIIDEMNNNAIEYGSKEDDINKIRLKTQKINSSIELNIEVEDSGTGNNSKSASSMERIKDKKLKKGYLKYNSIRGRGLFLIIINLVDNLYFKNSDSGGLIVGIKKILKK